VADPSTSGAGTEPASFRDPSSTVFYLNGRVLRGLSKQGAADYETLAATRFFPEAVQAGQVVGTRALPEEDLPAAAGGSSWAMVLEHDRVPVISYPYEWTFSMLKAAALLHLDLLQRGLAEGQTMKDGYAYNLQFVGSRPLFIDVGSFEPARPGEPWAGYRQFCQTFLYPLLLTAHKGVRFQPWLRGAVQGISPGDIRPLFTGLDVFKRGVLKHVVLHQAMDARFSKSRASDTRQELQKAGFSTELQAAAVKAIRKLVAGLRWKASDSAWSDYQRTSTYSDDEKVRKQAFVRKSVATAPVRLCYDLGANDGTYSRVAAEHSGYVVAADSDDLTVDLMFQALAKEGEERILPITLDLCDPSPGLGWRGRERSAFFDRDRPDVVLSLALIHHLAITGNVPLAELLDWWHGLGGRLVVEFVDPQDPMADRLLANKPAGMHGDYRRPVFERLLEERFEVLDREELPSGTRVLYHAAPKPSRA
jgi:hypothetical protein